MIKKAILVIMFLSFFVPNFVVAQNSNQEGKIYKNISDFSNLIPTVKIVSYDYGYSGGVYPSQFGSGSIISADGFILTNYHVVFDAEDEDKALDAFEICFSFNSGSEPICEYTASLVASYKEKDLALLKLDEADIRGNSFKNVPFYTYQKDKELKVGDTIKIIGYPGTGGDTLTTTQGVISGFSEAEDSQEPLTYIKSDADISEGSSGGTTVDEQGNIIGVPTMVTTGYDTLGYSIDLNSIYGWIEQNIQSPVLVENKNEILKKDKILFNDAKYTNHLDYPYYPAFSLDLNNYWKFVDITNNSVLIVNKNANDKKLSLRIAIKQLPFEDCTVYLQKIMDDLEKEDFGSFSNHKIEKVKFKDNDGYLLTVASSYNKSYVYFVAYGNSIFQLSYAVDLKDFENGEKKIQEILNSFKFIEAPKILPYNDTFIFDEVPFSIQAKGNFKLQKNDEAYQKDLILEFLQSDNPKADFRIYYEQLDEGDQNLTNEELLEEYIELGFYGESFSLINKNPNLVLDGLSGFSLIASYEGPDYQKTRKQAEIYLRNGDHMFSIVYDDFEDNYNQNLEDFRSILESFKFSGEHENAGVYDIGELDYTFKDIVNHRFISAISDLKDKNIIEGNDDKIFRPENPINRAEALKIILRSALYSKEAEKDKMGDLEGYKGLKFHKLDFKDTRKNTWYTLYTRYARDKKIIQGYKDGMFKPDAQVSLAEALRMLFKAHEIKIWQSLDEEIKVEWYKPYMDKAFALEILPGDMYDPNRLLTRAELAYIVDVLLKDKESAGFWY